MKTSLYSICLIFAFFALTSPGCEREGAVADGTAVETSQSDVLPAMKFHRPKTFAAAVSRLQEMHAALIADAELPAPKTYKVLEIIHGEGDGAHSHYYLADDVESGKADHHDHEEMSETEKLHEVQIDLLTEYADIVGWLSNLAADSDLNEEEWNLVKDVAGQLESLIEQTVSAGTASQEWRQSYRSQSDSVADCIQRLEKVIGQQAGQ